MNLPRSWRFQVARAYTVAAKPSSRLRKTVTMEHFIQRGRVISLWRAIVRGSYKIQDERTRAETLGFAREEFKRNKGVEDLAHIRYLISTGKTQWGTMERLIDGL